ncbi:MAG: hypothetical protein ACYSWU_21245, partial [Planctomycetota bacterium]
MNIYIKPETKVADLLEEFPQARGALSLFGIDPSEGQTDLAAAARCQNAPVDAVVAALTEAVSAPATASQPVEDWSSASPVDVI